MFTPEMLEGFTDWWPVAVLGVFLALWGALSGLVGLSRTKGALFALVSTGSLVVAYVAIQGVGGFKNSRSYDWYSDTGHRDFSELKAGSVVLYEEHALIPELDEGFYERICNTNLSGRPFRTSPRGFLLLSASDFEWIDPRNCRRRIHMSLIHSITSDGRVAFVEGGTYHSRRIVVDVLPGEWFVPGTSRFK